MSSLKFVNKIYGTSLTKSIFTIAERYLYLSIKIILERRNVYESFIKA